MRPSARKPRQRRIAGLVLAALSTTLLAGLLTVTLGAGTAQAAAYRFWGYFQWKDNAWAMATEGPASVTPKDGAVEGWRFAVSGEKTPPRLPRAAGDFEQICGSTPAETGKKRVALVIDYGIASEGPDGQTAPAPRGACSVTDTNATSAQVLAAVAEVREQKSLICGIDAFPTTGCGDPVKEEPAVASPEPAVALALPEPAKPTASASASPTTTTASTNPEPASSSGFPIWPVAGAVAVIVLVVGGLLLRRQRSADQAG
ncbi:SCO2322 family protein [Actinopolymorpha alba]|uniref:SCO2322 family protein n=1 Tax=Actinopolymorpha alba TaxID=533267 RepID=UPI0003631710|nr:SCO2322 family protein [Actinopolymorpha alba]